MRRWCTVRAGLEARARQLPSDGDTPWDQRLCDAFVELIRSARRPGGTASPFTVVVHVPMDTLLDESSDLSGELELDGLISADTVRRLACDATIIVGIDDDLGHTMYEGRQHRFPTETQRRELTRPLGDRDRERVRDHEDPDEQRHTGEREQEVLEDREEAVGVARLLLRLRLSRPHLLGRREERLDLRDELRG